MIVTYLSEESDRAKVLSRLGFSYGIGMVVGPSLGGFIATYFDEQSAALFAAAGSFLSVILVVIFIPRIPKTKAKGYAIEESSSGGMIVNVKEIGKLFFVPDVGFLLTIKLICGIPIGVIQSMFSSKKTALPLIYVKVRNKIIPIIFSKV
jgi:OCT family organic cation transporter-like MFS transporter 18